jgi:hypothetical protein
MDGLVESETYGSFCRAVTYSPLQKLMDREIPGHEYVLAEGRVVWFSATALPDDSKVQIAACGQGDTGWIR